MTKETIQQVYKLLFERFGPQHWWPGETKDEIIAGAILTQNTNWQNVEKAILNLKKASAEKPRIRFCFMPLIDLSLLSMRTHTG
jgi:endonuclease-3 related protein